MKVYVVIGPHDGFNGLFDDYSKAEALAIILNGWVEGFDLDNRKYDKYYYRLEGFIPEE